MKELTTGVYRIRNLVNGKLYIGSAASSFNHRWRAHRSHLRLNRHHNIYLQHSWNKYGEDNFAFEIVERCDPRYAVAFEQVYIDHYRATDRKHGYNLSPTAGSCRGIKRSPGIKWSPHSLLPKRPPLPLDRPRGLTPDSLLRTTEAVPFFYKGVTAQDVARWCGQGVLGATKLGSRWFTSRRAINEFMSTLYLDAVARALPMILANDFSAITKAPRDIEITQDCSAEPEKDLPKP